VPFDEGWKLLNYRPAVQGNLDPVTLFAGWEQVKQRAKHILDQAGNRPGHIFNLGHGILPKTPVENVMNLCKFVQEYSAQLRSATAAGSR
jgi:uroporphyrinogen decarboxylase